MQDNRSRVLIGSPIRQNPEILALFLESLERLEQAQVSLSYFFIDDNEEPESSRLLSQFGSARERVVIRRSDGQPPYIRNEITHYWNEELIWKVADYKNTIIRHAREHDYDYLFLVDSDLLLYPGTLERLAHTGKDIVSTIFWTRWQPEAMPQPQVWLWDEYSQWEQARGEKLDEGERLQRFQKFISKMMEPGLYEVGGLGACTLISRRALALGVSFDPISNLSFWGEDRHFCIRAAALGIPLFVDTHAPAFHIYRETDLPDARVFLTLTGPQTDVIPPDPVQEPEVELTETERPLLTLSMVLKNEGGRYLRQALEEHRRYIDQAVIIDDGSTDDTISVVLDTLQGIPIKLIRNVESRFHNEVMLRKQQWEETIKAEPGWILNLDADEWFERRFASDIGTMLRQQEIDVYCFRLYDFWSDTHYREDEFWNAHRYYRPFLLRYQPGFTYKWKETPQHCGRFPENVLDLPHLLSDIRLKHFGWAKPEDRLEKHARYLRLDPDAKYGVERQYESILDEKPVLQKWVEA